MLLAAVIWCRWVAHRAASWVVQDYTKLAVWHRARALTVAVNEATRLKPSRGAPGLRAQLLRAAMSVGANIAEGASRESRPDFARFVGIAIGSVCEVEHHLTVCLDLGVLDQSAVQPLLAQLRELRRMLFGLRRALTMRMQ